MTPPSAARVTSSSEAPTSSPVKMLRAALLDVPCPPAAPCRARVAGAHARAPSDEAAEVRRLGQRALGAGRGDLERVALAKVVELHRDALAGRERDAVGVVDEDAQAAPADDLGEQHLDVRLGLGEAGFDVVLEAVIVVLYLGPYAKKAGGRPLSVLLSELASRHESCRSSIASGPARVSRLRPARRRAARDRGRACSRRARGAASTRARAAGRPRDAAPSAASSGPGRRARSRRSGAREATAWNSAAAPS